MRLRVCDGNGERILPASVTAVERVFAPGVAIPAGTEISLTAGGVSLVAVALETREADVERESAPFRLLSVNREHASLGGPVSRIEALRQFREFVLTTGQNERVSP
jgi:hypothetical protein